MTSLKKSNILVLCTGNICRSPVAEAMLQQLFGEMSQSGIWVHSAGLHAPVGSKPHPLAVKTANARGFSVPEEKRSQQVMPSELRAADLIFVMESFQKRDVIARAPVVSGKTFLLGHWQNREIADPIGKDEQFFIDVAEQLELGCQSWAKQVQQLGWAA